MADNDPVVGAILYLAEMMIRNIDWKAEGPNADFIEECMDDMDMSWADTISEILSVLTYGFSFHEVIYKIRRGPDERGKYKSRYTDGKIGWKRIPIRSQHTLHSWEFADDGDIEAFNQQTNEYGIVKIPLDKGLLFRTRVSRDNPEGKSLLRNAYRPWYFKKNIEEVEGIGIERDLAGFPVLQAPENLDLWNKDNEKMVQMKQEAEALVQSIRRDSEEGVLLPFGWKLELLSTGSSRQFDTSAIIGRYDNRIAITMLSDLILIGGEKTGSFALAEAKQSLIATALSAQVNNIADVFNDYAIPKLLRMNGMEQGTIIVPGEVASPSVKDIALLLRSMKLDISSDKTLLNHLRKVTNMPVLDDATFERVYDKQEPNNSPQQEDNDDDTVENDLEQGGMYYGKNHQIE